MPDRLDMFFFYGSTYTYLTVMRVEEAAARSGIRVRWRPFNVREIMLEQGNIPFRDKPVKMRYMWKDIERRAARHGIPFDRIPTYPVDPDNLRTGSASSRRRRAGVRSTRGPPTARGSSKTSPPEIPNTSAPLCRRWAKIRRP